VRKRLENQSTSVTIYSNYATYNFVFYRSRLVSEVLLCHEVQRVFLCVSRCR